MDVHEEYGQYRREIYQEQLAQALECGFSKREASELAEEAVRRICAPLVAWLEETGA